MSRPRRRLRPVPPPSIQPRGRDALLRHLPPLREAEHAVPVPERLRGLPVAQARLVGFVCQSGGAVFGTPSRLGTEMGLVERMVQQAIEALRRQGELITHETVDDLGRTGDSVYRVPGVMSDEAFDAWCAKYRLKLAPS